MGTSCNEVRCVRIPFHGLDHAQRQLKKPFQILRHLVSCKKVLGRQWGEVASHFILSAKSSNFEYFVLLRIKFQRQDWLPHEINVTQTFNCRIGGWKYFISLQCQANYILKYSKSILLHQGLRHLKKSNSLSENCSNACYNLSLTVNWQMKVRGHSMWIFKLHRNQVSLL